MSDQQLKTLAPVNQTSRIGSLDLLRGFALLGILIVNIQGFAMIAATYSNPAAFGELTGLNYWAWLFTHVFFEFKVMSIFGMLFGAGMVLMWEKAVEKGKSVTGLHYRRMLWLLVFGLVHAYCIWYGDILVCYSICGMVLYWLRKWRPTYLIVIGLLMIMVPSLIYLLLAFSFQFMPEADFIAMGKDWSPPAAMVEQELAAYRGSWFEQMPHRANYSLMMQTFVFAIVFFWRSGGLIVMGMGLYKLGIFSAARSSKFYVIVGVIAGAIGWGLIGYGVQQNLLNEWRMEYSMGIGSLFNYWGSVFVAFTYVCLFMLIYKFQVAIGLQNALRCVGQMALTNYLTQSIICSLIFYGHGFGYVGYLERYQQVLIVIVIWVTQLIWSSFWLEKFRFGPFEWAWRSLAYWKRQPFLR